MNAADIKIPPEAESAAARAIYAHPLFPMTRDASETIARAAIVAALAAWPRKVTTSEFSQILVDRPALILPLPQEATSD